MKGLKYISLNEGSGYGEAARRYMLGLKNAGVNFTWTPMAHGKAWGMWYEPFEGSDPGDPLLVQFCNRPVDYDTVIVHAVPEYYPLWRQKEAGKSVMGYTVWETDKPPRHWIPLLNSMDALLVPCRWNKEVFEKHGVSVPIHVVPHIPWGKNPIKRSRPTGQFTFYTINTWTARKALWSLLTSYLEAFTSEDAAILVIKTSREDFTRKFFGRFYLSTARALNKIRKRYRNPARVRLIVDDLSRDEMLSLHGEGDCYVSLSRSEGWGLGAFDAAGFGKPVIMTGFGGQLDYLPNDLAYLVDCEIVPVRDKVGKASYSEDQNWAEPDTRQASDLMRHVFENPAEAGSKGAALADFIHSHFSESTIIDKLLKVLD